MVALKLCLVLVLFAGCVGSATGRDGFDKLLAGGGPPSGSLALTFFRTGLGDATLIELPNGRALLVDAGIGWRTGEILAYLERRGIRRLDGLLLTHPHPDHYGGMRAIVEQVEVGTFYENGVSSSLKGYRQLESALAQRGVPRRVLGRGDSLAPLAGPEVALEVLYPVATARGRVGNQNRATIVCRLVHGRVRFLLLGDAERTEERWLVANDPGRVPCDLLKLGHHASPGSGSREFLDLARPQVAVAMGTEVFDVPPFYSRPNYRIRSVLRGQGARLLTTHESGPVQVVSDGRRLTVQTASDRVPRQPARREGGLEVEAPDRAVHVQHFARQVEAAHPS